MMHVRLVNILEEPALALCLVRQQFSLLFFTVYSPPLYAAACLRTSMNACKRYAVYGM